MTGAIQPQEQIGAELGKLTPAVMFADVAAHLKPREWRTLDTVRRSGSLSLGRTKQGLGAGICLGFVEHQTETVSGGPHTHWRRRLYRLKEQA